MKAFKKFLNVLVLLFCFIAFSNTAHAKGESQPSDLAPIPLISGMDAYVRDCDELVLRQEPNTTSQQLALLQLGEHVVVKDQIGKWFEVEHNGISGFVYWKYIKFSESDINTVSDDGLLTLIGNSIIHYTSSENRDHNILIACSTLNGMTLLPAQQFKWSDVIGQTTKKKGYLSAPVLMNKKSVLGLGGGICQVSTTLYNAILDTTIVPDELHRHSIGSSYAKQDATVAHGSKDFIFTNPYDFSISIQMSSYKGVVFVNIYKINNLE